MFRKQILQRPNLRKKARLRPQIGQRVYPLLENFGLLWAFTIIACLAKLTPFKLPAFQIAETAHPLPSRRPLCGPPTLQGGRRRWKPPRP